MISKKRLKELIEQKETIYCIVKEPFIAGYSNILKIKELDLSLSINKEIFEDKDKFIYDNHILDFNNLYESKDDAEEYLQYGNRTRIVKFEAPTWEELQRMVNSTTEWNVDFCIDCSHKQDLIVSVCRTIGTMDKEQPYIIRLRHFYECEEIDFEYSREGYNKARDLCLKLFYGKG